MPCRDVCYHFCMTVLHCAQVDNGRYQFVVQLIEFSVEREVLNKYLASEGGIHQ